MSMSVRDDATGLEYAGALGPRGLFPTARNLARPAYLRMLAEIPRFHRRARGAAGLDKLDRRRPVRHHAAGVPGRRRVLGVLPDATSWSRWSPRSGRATRRWRSTTPRATCSSSSSTTGCSASSGRRSGAPSPAARASTSPGSPPTLDEVLRRHQGDLGRWRPPTGVEVTDGNGVVRTYDAVVVATHPGQALAMLAEPTRGPARRAGARSPTRATPRCCTPTPPCCRAPAAPAPPGTSVRPGRRPRPGHGHLRPDPAPAARHRHPLPGHARRRAPRRPGHGDRPDGVRAPALHARRRSRPSAGCRRSTPTGSRSPAPTTGGGSTRTARGRGWRRPSGWARVARCRRSGVSRLGAGAPRTSTTGVYDTTITHTRRTPFRRTFTHRSHTWLVDLDDLPDHGAARPVRGAATTSATRTARSARTSTRSSPRHGIEPRRRPGADGRAPAGVRPLLQPDQRLLVLRRATATQRAVVVEVHNTYGDRHAYLVHPDAQGRATHAEGRCTSRRSTAPTATTRSPCPTPGDRLHVAVTLHTDDGEVFSASLTGTPFRRRGRGGPHPRQSGGRC